MYFEIQYKCSYEESGKEKFMQTEKKIHILIFLVGTLLFIYGIEIDDWVKGVTGAIVMSLAYKNL